MFVALRAGEKAEALHSDIRLPASALRSAEVLDDPIRAVHGLRAPGTGVPGLVAVGTFWDHGKKIFAVVHHNTSRAVRLRFEGADFDEVIAACDDPDGVIARVSKGLTEEPQGGT